EMFRVIKVASMKFAVALMAASIAASSPVEAAVPNLTLSVANEFGVLSDVGATTVTLGMAYYYSPLGGHFSCETPPTVSRTGNRFAIGVNLLAAEPQVVASCQTTKS